MDLDLLQRTLAELGEPVLPARAGVEVDRDGRQLLRHDDQPAARPARRAQRERPVLHADRRARGARERRHDQGADADRRRAPARGGADALSRRAPVAVRLVTVGLPADLHVLRDRADAVRPQPDGLGDPRSGAPLPQADRGRPLRVHGHGRADDERRQRARRVPAASRPRHRQPSHGGLDRRLDSGDRRDDRRPDAAAAGAVAARREPRAALGADARQRPLSAG